MQVTVDDKIKENPAWASAVTSANRVLEEEAVGPTAEQAKAEWKLINGKERNAAFRLELSDDIGQAEAQFTPEELLDRPYHMRISLRWLWGDMLYDGFHKLVQQLKATVQDLEEE